MRRTLAALVLLLGLMPACRHGAKSPQPAAAKAFGTALVEVGGGKQAAGIGTALDQPVVVQVNDAQGSAVANALVHVRVSGGGGSNPESGLTGPDGQLTANITLGGSAGNYEVVASTNDAAGKLIELRLDEVALGYQETLGKQLNDVYCARCHDPESTPERVSNHDNLTAQAHAFTEGGVLNAMSDADLTAIMAHGGPALSRSPEMPPYGFVLSKSEIAALAAYIRAIADPPYRSKGAVYAKN
ncbi:MAG: c-type cytochrome [Bryobacteraceae bacterium]|jgi:mono/diheme cytochrome c family protein